MMILRFEVFTAVFFGDLGDLIFKVVFFPGFTFATVSGLDTGFVIFTINNSY